jgi:hypothetical protein
MAASASGSLASLLFAGGAPSVLKHIYVMRHTLGLLGVSLLLAGCASASATMPQNVTNATARQPFHAAAGLSIPPRLQWMANYGYCGETSLISAGLYYGQYVSQYTARAIASAGTPQNRRGSQLLLGVNDTSAAKKMHLNAVEWNTAAERSTRAFLAWVKANVTLGYPVTIGVYTNEYLFYGKTNPRAGDPSYDHIVPVTGAANDALTFSDNGLWSPTGDPKYSFTYPFDSFARTRQEANAKNAPVYSIANDGRNYGIAITGVTDLSHETLPVRLATDVNYERPGIRNGSSTRPTPMPLLLTITVSNLQPGTKYVLYRYNRFADVPDDRFNAQASKAAQRLPFQISAGASFATTQRIMSDRVAVYRAVAASAP